MTEIIADTSHKNAFQQYPLKDVRCNNNLKSVAPFVDVPSSSKVVASPAVAVPHSQLIISNMESVIRSVKKQHVVKKKKRKVVEPEISDISMILSSSLSFVSPNASTDDAIAAANGKWANIFAFFFLSFSQFTTYT